MSNFMITDPLVGAPQPVTATATYGTGSTANPPIPFPLGISVKAVDRQTGSGNIGAGVFVYCRGASASAVSSIGQFVHIWNGSAVLLAHANSASMFPIGVAAGVLSATNVYGWVQVAGNCDYARGTNSSIAAGVKLYVAAGTAGYLVTNAAGGEQVNGVVAPVSYTSSQSQSLTVQLNYPRILGVSAGL
jgi:hypothetical protein